MNIVHLKWLDSYTPDVGAWTCQHELDLGELKAAMECESVGFVLEEDDEVIILASSQGGQDHKRLVFAPIVIPKVAVIERKEIESSV